MTPAIPCAACPHPVLYAAVCEIRAGEPVMWHVWCHEQVRDAVREQEHSHLQPATLAAAVGKIGKRA